MATSAAPAGDPPADYLHLLDRLRDETRQRVLTVRKQIRYTSLTDEEVEEHLISALGQGPLRARVVRFSTARQIPDEWWREQRRTTAGRASDRRYDVAILTAAYPEFVDFVPAPPLTDDEVVAAAASDFRTTIAGSGTEYHFREHFRRYGSRSTGEGAVLLQREGGGRFTRLAVTPEATVPLNAEGEYEFVDPTAHLDVENFAARQLLEDDRDPLGPVVTRIFAIAAQEYGPEVALLWITERLYLDARYTELLRALCPTDLDAAAFQRNKQLLLRQLPRMTQHIFALAAQDPDLLALHDVLDVAGPRPVPCPTQETPASVLAYRAEKARRAPRAG